MGLEKYNKEISKETFHAFSNEEIEAIKEQIPMTQELFNSIMDKCEEIGPDASPVFVQMLDEDKYETFLDGYEAQFEWRLNNDMRKMIEDMDSKELAELELKALQALVTESIMFTEEENYAIDHIVSMTQELFDSIIDKCGGIGTKVDSLFFRLLDEYPAFMDVRSSKIEEEVKKANLPLMEPEVAQKIKKRLDIKIEEYHRKNKE